MSLVDRDGIEPPLPGLQSGALPAELPIRLGYSQVISPRESPSGNVLWNPMDGWIRAVPEFGADGESRPHNLLFTTQPLCRLSYISQYRRGRRTRTAESGSRSPFNERLCPNAYTIRIVKELTGAIKNPGWIGPTGVSLGASLEGSMFEPSRNHSWKALSHRFPTIRGERIKTVRRRMRGHRAQADAAVPAGIGAVRPTRSGGGRYTESFA